MFIFYYNKLFYFHLHRFKIDDVSVVAFDPALDGSVGSSAGGEEGEVVSEEEGRVVSEEGYGDKEVMGEDNGEEMAGEGNGESVGEGNGEEMAGEGSGES